MPLTPPAAAAILRRDATRSHFRADRWERLAARETDPVRAAHARDRAAFHRAAEAKAEASMRAALRGYVRCMGCAGTGLTVLGRPAGIECDECDHGYVLDVAVAS